jgi:hypothetical protein
VQAANMTYRDFIARSFDRGAASVVTSNRADERALPLRGPAGYKPPASLASGFSSQGRRR